MPRLQEQAQNGTLRTVFEGALVDWLVERDAQGRPDDEVLYVEETPGDTPRRGAVRSNGTVQWEEPELALDLASPVRARRARPPAQVWWDEANRAIRDEREFDPDAPTDYFLNLRGVVESGLAAIDAERAFIEARIEGDRQRHADLAQARALYGSTLHACDLVRPQEAPEPPEPATAQLAHCIHCNRVIRPWAGTAVWQLAPGHPGYNSRDVTCDPSPNGHHAPSYTPPAEG
jgi:hypothetical protein